MGSVTNVEAAAVGTLAWLADLDQAIAIPVYQRRYRWEFGDCEQLLADVRAVADAEEGQTHFLGSILSARTPDEQVLIDGQQRITTLMLLVAALQHTVRGTDPVLAADLDRVLRHPTDRARTKLRPHPEWADAYASVVLGGAGGGGAGDGAAGALGAGGGLVGETRFHDNYAYFRSQVSLEEAPRIRRGLERLEHVAIALGGRANAQQIFESLNSTGEPLRDHELIHNYVLMGLTHEEQVEIEDEYWVPIERATGEGIGEFFRDYLILTTGRSDVAERGVYDEFRARFPRLGIAELREHAAEWREYAGIRASVVRPELEPDADVAGALAGIGAFGAGMTPLAMLLVRDLRHGLIGAARLVESIGYVESLLLRRLVVGVSRARLVARLCRAWRGGVEEFTRAVARITPSDERVRLALRYRALPHPAHVLDRLEGAAGIARGAASPVSDDLVVERVFPLAAPDTWTGDGERAWRDYSEDEQNSLRAITDTLGNLALLETSLADAALGRSFPDKRRLYARSGIPGTRAIAELPAWGSAAIGDRTGRLAPRLIGAWPRPAIAGIDDDGLTPILDARRREGWFPGWQAEYEYVEYRGEHWEVHDVKALFRRVFRRGWTDAREATTAFVAANRGPIYASAAWHGEWDELDAAHQLFLGWQPQYLLTAVQGLLEATGSAEEVFLAYPPGE